MARPSPYVRPYGANAPWNRTVSGLTRHPNSSEYVNRLYYYAGDRKNNFNLIFQDYTFPVYYEDDSTVLATVNCSIGNMDGQQIPWNPAWTWPSGTDAQVIVLDATTGYEYNMWQISSYSGGVLNCTTCNLIQTGESAGSGSPASYFTKENGFSPSRGVGVQYFAMLVQPEEIAKGVIEHALCMPLKNPATNYSHVLYCNDRSWYDDFPLGYVSPATKLEHTNTPSCSAGSCPCPNDYDSQYSNVIPEGMRFALDITDAQIETWITSKTSDTALRNFGRIVARALREYGWFITDTSGASSWQFEENSSAQGLWTSLAGIDSTSTTVRDLFDGLFTDANYSSRIYAIVPSDEYGTPPPPPSNNAPSVNNPGNQTSNEGDSPSLQIVATDLDGDTLYYTATGLPTGLSIDYNSGLIDGYLDFASAGVYNPVVTVDDLTDTTDVGFTWTVYDVPVPPGNSPPSVTNPGNQFSNEGQVISKQIVATDADGDTLYYTATGLPTGLSIDYNSGLISGTLGYSSAGVYNPVVTVDDLTDTTDVGFTWTVYDVPVPPSNTPPSVTNPGSQADYENTNVSLQIVATDADGDTLHYYASSLPTGLSINVDTGLISGYLDYNSAGVYSSTVWVNDGTVNVFVYFTWTVYNVSVIPITEDFNSYRLNTTWPPGYVNYPEVINAFIERCEDLANEIIEARAKENSLVDNLQNNLLSSYTLENNFNGKRIYKFSNMDNSFDPNDYFTLYEARIHFGLNEVITAWPIDDSSWLDIPHAQLIAGNNSLMNVFNQTADSLTYDAGNLQYYPPAFNKTYILDWNGKSANTVVKLNHASSAFPILGDRLRFIFYNLSDSSWGIIDNTRKIMNTAEKVTFSGLSYTVIDLVYASTLYGWHVTNFWWG